MGRLLRLLLIFSFVLGFAVPVSAQSDSDIIGLLDKNSRGITALTDGDRVQLSLKLASAPAASVQADFFLDGVTAPVASCSIPAGADACTTAAFNALGWYWGDHAEGRSTRQVSVIAGGQKLPVELGIQIKPRPVVMVHGFISSWETWQAYLGPQGYLASLGLQGFAVGDGQAPGVLNTGNPSNPAGQTNSIAQNAEVLKDYIAGVQKLTGAEKVDLLVHSMGGMITRYYLDRVMTDDNVAQVIFLGTPMSGSACVYPLAALGYLVPASLEILPDYMDHIFNQQIIHRRGVPFYMIAGTLLVDPLTSPCADAPSDTVVGLDSATSITLDGVQKLPMFHGSLPTEKQVFSPYVAGLLQSPRASFFARPDLQAPAAVTGTAQFSRTYTGHLAPGGTTQVTIDIDPAVSLANFSLYDSTHSLDIEVRGASGNIITLDTQRNGVLKISDLATMFYLGYGFKAPKPGKWVITLKTTTATPSSGADYGLVARYTGGAMLSASSSPTIPALGQAVKITAKLQVDGSNMNTATVEALIRKPDGTRATLPLSADGDAYTAVLQPDQPGLYAVEVRLSGKNADGFGIDRGAFLTFEVQPGSESFDRLRGLVLAAGLALVALVVGMVILSRRRRSRAG